MILIRVSLRVLQHVTAFSHRQLSKNLPPPPSFFRPAVNSAEDSGGTTKRNSSRPLPPHTDVALEKLAAWNATPSAVATLHTTLASLGTYMPHSLSAGSAA
jgi:hypothetical protein